MKLRFWQEQRGDNVRAIIPLIMRDYTTKPAQLSYLTSSLYHLVYCNYKTKRTKHSICNKHNDNSKRPFNCKQQSKKRKTTKIKPGGKSFCSKSPLFCSLPSGYFSLDNKISPHLVMRFLSFNYRHWDEQDLTYR